MEPGTPRLRSAFPQTPRRGDNPRASLQQRANPFRTSSPTSQQKPLPRIPTLRETPTLPSEPLIPTHIIDAPTQRLYAVAFWAVLWSWRAWDFSNLVDAEEQSLWLFMKWVAIDGVFLFGLPGLRIPWLEWSSATMTLIFLAHALLDGMLMFRIPIPILAGFAALWRGVWGAYETAINEHGVNPDTVLFNSSLILGRQVVHILPEGSAILNPQKETFCLDGKKRTEARLPIMINATDPISVDILHVDLDTQLNSTIHISKSQIKAMHKEASRLITYSEDPNEPKTLYYSVKKPGLYALLKVVDASNLEVSRKKVAHTVVVSCPSAEFLPAPVDRCRGELSNVELHATGTPPMKVKYRKVVNKASTTSTFENIQPEELISPLLKQDSDVLVVPARVDTSWAKSQSVRVPLSEGLVVAGSWTYAIDEVVDGFGHRVEYTDNDHKLEKSQRKTHLSQHIDVHERPVVNLQGCTPQQPLKVPRGRPSQLPIQYASTGHGAIPHTSYHLEWIFTPQVDMSSSSGHGATPQTRKESITTPGGSPYVTEPGLYTLTGVSTDYCSGDVLEPASCLLQNPPEPQIQTNSTGMFDKCAGRPIGLLVDIDLIGTPPFELEYTSTRQGHPHHTVHKEWVNGLRGQVEFTPVEAGNYTYVFTKISDAVYKNQKLVGGPKLTQDVKPSASARFLNEGKKVTCIDQAASFEVSLNGEPPFVLEYEIIHNGKRQKMHTNNITSKFIHLDTPILTDGGDYTLGLVSITDGTGCKELLKDEAKVTVRHQKPKVSFGQIEGRRSVDTLEGKKVSLPLRLVGEPPWTVNYLDSQGKEQTVRSNGPNDKLDVDRDGMYELLDVHDNICPGLVDSTAKEFQVHWIPRPQYRISPDDIQSEKNNVFVRSEVCEGDEDAVEVLFKGSPPYKLSYIQTVRPEVGAVAPRNKELRAALNVASLRMETSVAGAYEYKLAAFSDGNYPEHSPKHFTPISIKQKVNSRPSAAFATPGKTYSFCSVESDGEEVIPVTLHGVPPFELEVEIKHHGTVKPEMVHYTNIESKSHSIHIPHSRLHLGKSAVSLRRVSDARGCSRTLDSTAPRVQISVHDAPTIVSLEERSDYCVGDRLNFGLAGVAPFQVFYTFEGQARKASVSSGNTFKRLAEKPGVFRITGLQDSASTCKASSDIEKRIHGMPSVRVSKGKDSYVDIHEGGQAELTFDFGGTPPFEFTYTRSSNTDKHGKKKSQVLDMKSEISHEHSMRIWASEEGTYEVVSIKDAHCAYAKPGINVEQAKGSKQKKLGYY